MLTVTNIGWDEVDNYRFSIVGREKPSGSTRTVTAVKGEGLSDSISIYCTSKEELYAQCRDFIRKEGSQS